MHLLIVIGTRPNFIKVTRFRKVMDTIPGAKLNVEDVLQAIENPKEGVIPPLWDGHATERILEVIRTF